MCVSRLVVSIVCLNLLALSGLPASAQSDATVFRVQALNDSGVREGTCFVVRQEQRAEGTFLVLVTSARLFDRESRRRARVFVDPNAPVEIGPDAITTPYANRRDVAVLQATVNGPPISALPMVFDPIPAGSLFVVAGLRPDGSRAFVAQHVRFCATRTVIGDSATAELAGCQGAPAIVEQGVFGIVSECGPDRVPEITPLAVSRSFLRRAVPEAGAPSSEMSKFRVEEREVIGPQLSVGLGDLREGELDVPLHLREREALVSAQARFLSQPPVTRADVTIISLQDRRVRLRFALGGEPVPALYSSAWPAAEALVVVHLRVVVVPKF